MRYIPHTEADRQHMLRAIGVASVDDLFADIPAELQLGRALEVPSAMPEPDLFAHMAALAEQNRAGDAVVSFLGAGVYRHYVPRAVNHMLLRGELYTAYTPYQPEVAQGTLQIIFEFQTMISELLAMDVVNASMYDGSTAVSEAALMAARVTKRDRVLVTEALHPEYRQVMSVTCEAAGLKLETIPVTARGVTDLAAAEARLGSDVACLVVGYPTFFGTLDDVQAAADLCHAHGALLVSGFSEAIAFGLLTPPGALGADIVAGEGQSLGVAPSFGGPHLGLFAARDKHVRQMPGRIAGETVDARGNRGFVLTLSTREQHIRRERATSNICTNQGLMATAATIYMTLLGPTGLEKVARASHLLAERTKQAICALPGYALAFDAPTFNEFVVRTPAPAADIVAALAAEGIAPGVALGRWDDRYRDALLVTATETTKLAEIDALTAALARFR